nr:ATP-binding cassette sub-family A member 3-like isoform X3 [Microcebus murinus]XP_012645580.1 ATP-binding cassette sub-family A member 3-like isoform X3 [Microcebus murinus]XP_020137274.1 ATP-binding cassette sub-family A member 3-like isoform X3 [Microcebus murinus]XP_020137277.1 ATP-binding cassette sub-family A member 3-like isoform X3 [Microcebus murinus]
MDVLTFNQFAVLLWKNFTLKRRNFISLILKVIAILVIALVFLLFRSLTPIDFIGPLNFTSQPISTLPSFLKYPSEWELIYIPSNIDVVKEITENVKRNLNISIKVRGFSSETEFENYIHYDPESQKVLAAIVFDCDFRNSSDPLPLQVKYHLRFMKVLKAILLSDGLGWQTASLFPNGLSDGPRNPYQPDGGNPEYIKEGFLAVQHALDKAIMLYHESSAGKKLFDSISIFVQRFPYPLHSHDSLLWISSRFLPLVFILTFAPTVLSIVRAIVWEKEQRLKEYQLIIGLKNWMIWATHFFTFFLLDIIIIVVICMLFCTKVVNEPIFRYSDCSFIFVFFVCYAIASIFFGFMVSTFFSNVHFAAPAGNFLFFVSFFPFNFISQHYGNIILTNKLAACLSSNVAFALGLKLLLQMELKGVGVKWNNLWTPATLGDNLIFGYLLGMLLLDAFLYGLATWYIECVFPGQFGMPQPWYFFLMRSYWFGEPRITKNEEEIEASSSTESYFEDEPTKLVAGIQIKHLHKEFRQKTLVNNLSLNIYEGQITILLGHDGAGKTTTLNILTGQYPPTRGEACINGYYISNDIINIRKSLSFCPQRDLLFPDFTVSEHLYFYSVIKGIPQKMYPIETDHMLSIFNLLEKRDTFSQSLTEGMKRKLSIIIALLGGSKVMILDEPSRSMDPVSRRVTWDLLRQYKHNCTILMTTHYMDEADILGDRIAILVKGTLKCCGSSVFLKHIYGAGYHIVMKREPHCDIEEISAIIHSHVPDATLENDIGAELSYILPKEYTQRFEALFNDLEKKQKELGITNFGVSNTTMEEVFLKVYILAHFQRNTQRIQSLSLKSRNIRRDKNQKMNIPINYERPFSSSLNDLATIKFNSGFPLYFQQFWSMFIKRALFTWRSWKLMLLQIIVILVVTTYLLKTQHITSGYDPGREMDLSQYGQTIVPYSVSGNSSLALDLIKNLEIFLKPKNQKLQEVQGNITDYIMENKKCLEVCIIALSIKVEKYKTVITILFNNEAYHSAATSLAVLDNILFMSLSGPSASITVSNKPQPQPLYHSNIKPARGSQVVLSLAFGMAVMVSNFCLQTSTERISKAKQIQFLSGVYLLPYWLSALLCDLIYYFLLCCLLVGVFICCRMDAFVVEYHFLDVMLIFMLYGWCAIPLMYLGSFLFSSSTAAYIKLTLFNYFSTVFSLVVHKLIKHNDKVFSNFTKNLIRNIFMIIPNYNFAISLSMLFDDFEVKRLCAKHFRSAYLNCSKPFTQNNIYSFGEHGIAKFLIAFAAMGLFYLLLLLSLEITFWNLKNFVLHNIVYNAYKKFIKFQAVVSNKVIKKYGDEDTENERKKVLELLQTLQENPVLLKELTKIYFKCPVVKAVRNISLVVNKSECFGLLGLNGAGKTTVFKMLTGEETTTSGTVLINGISITENIRKVRSRIGHCPQSDCVLSHMTGRELLIMYARLWGVPEPSIYKYVEAFLCSMCLKTHADEFVYTYSGKSKRRLCTAIALMGKPSIIFLDEPLAGMDPIARRLLWDTITWMCKTGKTIIIASHSMRECETLCTRLAIMVKGRFTCLGSPQHLKNKFGNIYTLTAKIKTNTDEDKVEEEFKEFIKTTFPGSMINQDCQGIIGYYIPSQEIHWGKVFRVLEEAKILFHVKDYSVRQITLEQIFLTVANTDKMESDLLIKLL